MHYVHVYFFLSLCFSFQSVKRLIECTIFFTMLSLTRRLDCDSL
jgi:hypothetical protein